MTFVTKGCSNLVHLIMMVLFSVVEQKSRSVGLFCYARNGSCKYKSREKPLAVNLKGDMALKIVKVLYQRLPKM